MRSGVYTLINEHYEFIFNAASPGAAKLLAPADGMHDFHLITRPQCVSGIGAAGHNFKIDLDCNTPVDQIEHFYQLGYAQGFCYLVGFAVNKDFHRMN